MHRSVLPGGHGRNLGRPDGVKARPPVAEDHLSVPPEQWIQLFLPDAPLPALATGDEHARARRLSAAWWQPGAAPPDPASSGPRAAGVRPRDTDAT